MDPSQHRSTYKISLSILGLILSVPLQAEDAGSFSVMLSGPEQRALQEALGLAEPGVEDIYQEVSSSENRDAILFLSAIIYLTSDKWALWLNDQVVNTKTAFPGILLEDVQPDAVTFAFENNPKKHITLGLNQSYSYNQKRVIDGDARLAETLQN